MKSYKLTNDDIQFISELIVKLQQGKEVEFNAETVAQELMASIICCNIRNGG